MGLLIISNNNYLLQSLTYVLDSCNISTIKNNGEYNPLRLREKFGNIKVIFITDYLDNDDKYKKLFNSFLNNDILSVFFIKYSRIICRDKEANKYINKLNAFLNTNLNENNFEKKNEEDYALSIYNKYNLFYQTTPTILSNKIVLLKTNEHYRFGDVIFHKGYRWKESNKFILNNKEFEGTILREYIERSPFNNYNTVNGNYLPLLKSIINNRIKNGKYELPGNKELVMHLRLGDIVNCKQKFLRKQYIKIINNHIQKNKINKLTICCAFHYGNYLERNLWIFDKNKHLLNIKRVTELFRKILNIPNIIIDVRSSENIDLDLIYMSKAKFFQMDTGGFSMIINSLVKI